MRERRNRTRSIGNREEGHIVWWCCCSRRLDWFGLALGLRMPFGVPFSGNQAPKLTPFSHFSLTHLLLLLCLLLLHLLLYCSLQNYNGRRRVFVLQGTCSLVSYLLLSTVKPQMYFLHNVFLLLLPLFVSYSNFLPYGGFLSVQKFNLECLLILYPLVPVLWFVVTTGRGKNQAGS